MEMILLKAKCKNLSNFFQKTIEVDFITEKRVSQNEIEENAVTHIINNIYKLNTMAFVGINASGKTSTLNVLSSILDIYLGNSSLSYEMLLSKHFSDYIEIETFYYCKSTSEIIKIWSKIRKNDEEKAIYFDEEILSIKKINAQTNKTNIYIFDEKHNPLDRKDVDKTYLKREDSIFSSLMNKSLKKSLPIIDMCDVKFNFLTALNYNMVMAFIRYLDPSIAKFEIFKEKGKLLRFKIRFENHNEEIIVDHMELDSCLSSGTIKGISFLSNAYIALKSGGYLLIDEIENHLNKTVVINIIRMFSSDINNNAATLLFSTHYSEILDAIDRSDSIYVLNKERDIHVNKYSKIAGSYDRIDKKRSDVILSGALKTAPKYNAYMNMIDAFREKLGEENSDD